MSKRIFRKTASPGLFSLFLLVLSFCGLLNIGLRTAQSASEGIFYRNSLDDVDVVRRLPTEVNDVVYDPSDHKLYASRPSRVGNEGNSISRIDPVSAATESSVFVGSEPTKLALSDDGHSMYVVLDGAFGVRRYDTSTQSAGIQFSLGTYDTIAPYTASDIAVVPGNPNRVAIARYKNGVSPPGGGVAAFDNGVRLFLTGPDHSAGANYLAFANSTTLYGGGIYDGLRTMTVSDNGVVDSNTNTSFGVGVVKYDSGRIYSSGGQVIDPQARTVLGTFVNASSTAFAPDSSVGRAYYATRDSSTSTVAIKAFDINTYVLIGTLSIPNVTADPASMVRFGTNGLAMRTSDGRLFLIQTSLIPTNDPLPIPSVTPTLTPTPTPSPYPNFIRQIPLANKDLVYSTTVQKLLVSVPSSDGPGGNSIAQMDPTTGTIESRTFVGSEPGRLALTDDQQTLYVGLNGAGAVRKFDIQSHTAGMQFSLGLGDFPNTAYDMDVMPGNSDTIAVSYGNGYSSGGTGLYDNGVRRRDLGGSGYIEFRSPSELIATNTRYSVTPNGFTYINSLITGTSGDFTLDNGTMYTANGRVVDLASQTIKGTFTGVGSNSSIIIDSPNNRAYYLTNSLTGSGYYIRAYALDTYLQIGSIFVPLFSNTPGDFVRWGSNGFAFRDDFRVFLLQTTLLDPSTPIPTPTPTVTPTPTPSPANDPTFIRQINLPANDIVYSASSGSIYATVPSSAGPERGNSITKIDPATGVIGTSTFIGSEPTLLRMSDDGQTLYTILYGAANAIRRFDVPTQTAGSQFTPEDSFRQIEDLEVMPGTPGTIALGVRYNGVAVYDNGVRRPATATGGLYSANSIEFADASTIYGYDNETTGYELGKFTVAANGVTGSTIASGLISGGAEIHYSDGLLYSTTGRVVDPSSIALKGTFAGNGGAMAVDNASHRVFFVSGNILNAYDSQTFLKIGSATLPAYNGYPTSLVRWGENGLALRVSESTSGANDSRIYILQSTLVSPTAPLPTGVSLSASSYSQNESGSRIITISRTGDLSQPSSVDYTTVDGTAIAGQDYSARSGTITFAAGESTKTVSVPIIGDNIYEGNETFSFVLSNVTGVGTLVEPSVSTITILDNDPQPSISSTSISVNEPPNGSTAQAVFTVRLSNPSTQTVTVNYATGNGTATGGIDYISTNGTLTFAPLETQKNVSVGVLGDANSNEPNETFFLNLSGAVNGTVFTTQYVATIVNYVPAKTLMDFDGDGKTDIGVTRPNGGIKEWWISRSSDSNVFSTVFGVDSDISAPADFTGDGKTDIAIFRPSTGQWFILKSEDFTYLAFPFGSNGDLPMPADYDGDGKADPAVFRPSAGTWFISRTSDGQTTIAQFGTSGDQPVVADYDGDGKADMAVYRQNGSVEEWWIQRSSSGLFATVFGVTGDKAVPGDYTGDGKADVAIFRGSTGQWFILRSEDLNYLAFPWGASGDLPVPGDYDGDGKFDAAVFRPSSATWFINRTGGQGPLITGFGAVADSPVAGAFVQ